MSFWSLSGHFLDPARPNGSLLPREPRSGRRRSPDLGGSITQIRAPSSPGSGHTIQHYLGTRYSRVFPCIPVCSKRRASLTWNPLDPDRREGSRGGVPPPWIPPSSGSRGWCTSTSFGPNGPLGSTGLWAQRQGTAVEPRGPLRPGGGATPLASMALWAQWPRGDRRYGNTRNTREYREYRAIPLHGAR